MKVITIGLVPVIPDTRLGIAKNCFHYRPVRDCDDHHVCGMFHRNVNAEAGSDGTRRPASNSAEEIIILFFNIYNIFPMERSSKSRPDCRICQKCYFLWK